MVTRKLFRRIMRSATDQLQIHHNMCVACPLTSHWCTSMKNMRIHKLKIKEHECNHSCTYSITADTKYQWILSPTCNIKADYKDSNSLVQRLHFLHGFHFLIHVRTYMYFIRPQKTQSVTHWLLEIGCTKYFLKSLTPLFICICLCYTYLQIIYVY